MKRVLFLSLFLSCLITFSGCLDDSDDSEECLNLIESQGTIPITMGCGDPLTQPSYQWDGGNISTLQVKRLSDDMVMWFIRAPEDLISPPVQHSVVPAGASVIDSEELQFGIPYEVKAVRTIPGESGTLTFTLIQP